MLRPLHIQRSKLGLGRSGKSPGWLWLCEVYLSGSLRIPRPHVHHKWQRMNIKAKFQFYDSVFICFIVWWPYLHYNFGEYLGACLPRTIESFHGYSSTMWLSQSLTADFSQFLLLLTNYFNLSRNFNGFSNAYSFPVRPLCQENFLLFQSLSR